VVDVLDVVEFDVLVGKEPKGEANEEKPNLLGFVMYKFKIYCYILNFLKNT
jgi:hypothetical protein